MRTRHSSRGVSAVCVLLATLTVLLAGCAAAAPSPNLAPAAATSTAPSPSATPEPAIPPALSQDDLAGLPHVYYDALIPELLDAGSPGIAPEVTWQVATPIAAKTGIYATATASSEPVGYIDATTVETPTALPVYGTRAGWLLVGTPARNVLPSQSEGTSVAATFGWVRAADFTVSTVESVVRVHVADHAISIETKDGEVTAAEQSLTLGSPEAPTPSAGTLSYVSAIYTDAEDQPWTGGEPIALLGAHSETLDSYNGNAGLTAIHYSTSGGSHSHGCVRVSAETARIIGALPVGTPVIFE